MPIDPKRVIAVHSHDAKSEVERPPEPGFGLAGEGVKGSAVYRALEALFVSWGLDRNRAGSSYWNPLGDFLAPGERVLIKPNLVYHKHYRGGLLHSVVTDPRLVRAAADYVFRAIGPTGKLIIGDAPLQSADWEELCEQTGLGRLASHYTRQGFDCELRDFRTLSSVSEKGLKVAARRLAGDPAGYCAVDLGTHSMHAGRNWESYRVTNYDPSAMKSHHNAARHEYLVSRSLLESSVVINMSKLKTHRKTGLTGPLKNLIGINGCKDWLPHHTKGSTEAGGDEYRRNSAWKQLSTWLVEHEETVQNEVAKRGWSALRRSLWMAGRRLDPDPSWEGSWYGNDTLWRTILDLNRASYYADSSGVLRPTRQRRFLAITDALLAGEGEGPMAPDPVPMGVLLGGETPAAVELAAVRLAGWPEERLPQVRQAFGAHRLPLAEFRADEVSIAAFDAGPGGPGSVPFERLVRPLRPSQGWRALFEQAEARQEYALR